MNAIETICCRKKVCRICQSDPHQTVWVNYPEYPGFYCRSHLQQCQICCHFSLETEVTVCCGKRICAVCQVPCYGCSKVHCADHTDDHHCRKEGCCFGDEHPGNTQCLINGSLCYQCQRPLTVSERRCHPIRSIQHKLCPECFRSKQIICSFCRMFVPIEESQRCDRCQITCCRRHLVQTQMEPHRARSWCSSCLQ